MSRLGNPRGNCFDKRLWGKTGWFGIRFHNRIRRSAFWYKVWRGFESTFRSCKEIGNRIGNSV